MPEDTGLTSRAVQKIVKGYYSSIKSIADLVEKIGDENGFFTEGFIAEKIEVLENALYETEESIKLLKEKKKLGELTTEELQELNKLHDDLNNIIENVAFYKSQKIDNVKDGLAFLESVNYLGPLLNCLLGIQSYYSNNLADAEEKLRAYFSDCPQSFHFLGIKTFAILCASAGKWHQAKKFAMRGIYLRPDDMKLHYVMRDAHKALNEAKGFSIEEEIISLLG